MAIRINENSFSLYVNRNLSRANINLENAFRRLSSGEKITRSADDPAGLANSHQLRAKIQGLQRNIVNTEQGINLLTVAESSLSNVTSILQRMRELSIQASSDAMADEQRLLIQEEINTLLEEMDRVAVQANYNDRALLDGTFQNLRLQVGTRIDENIPIQIESARISDIGATARVSGLNAVGAAPILGGGDLTINNFNIPASEFDGISLFGGDASAIAKAAAINSVRDTTGVRAVADPTVFSDGGASILGGNMDGSTSTLLINGVNIGAVAWSPGDADGILRDRINAFSERTGVEASRGPNGELVLTADDGRNVRIETTGGVAQDLGLSAAPGDVSADVTSSITLISAETIQVGGDLTLIGFGGGQATTFVDPTTAVETIRVLSFEDAQSAIASIDVALGQVLQRRANLGSIQSRLDKTLEDLMLNVENLSSADSRIRDADFAVESAALTQSQIIQEAGLAVLAQANIVPRQALNLLGQQ